MTSVLVVEDDRDVRAMLRQALERAGLDVRAAETGAEGMTTLRVDGADVVLLDLDLPDADGLDLIPMMTPLAPVIVLTGRRSDDAVVTGLERGADDFVVKPCSPRALIARLEAVLRRRGQPIVVERGPLRIDTAARIVTVDGEQLDLTRRELDLLLHLASNPGRVVTRDELLRAVWHSSEAWQAASTVTEHVRRVRQKLGDASWIESVRGVGYRLAVPERRAG